VNGFREQYDQPTRILLVDGENSVRESLYTLLENDGHEVLAARDGRDALTIFHRSVRPIDLLVTDCNTAGMSGLELARACARRNPDVAVLYLSASQASEELLMDLTSGWNRNERRAFLAKPVRRADLLRKTRELLAPGFAPAAIPGILKLQLAVPTSPRAAERENS
jgi:CheY-like chemotaxis protein